jgi:ankyrin repeat protein
MLLKDNDEKRYQELQEQALDYAREGETDALQKMLEHGLPVNLANSKGNTLLMLAAYHDHPKTVQLLLDFGAKVDQPNDRGQTPLAGVAFKGFVEVARLLLESEANPLAPQGTAMGIEMTPLRFAMLFGRKEIQQLFEEHLTLSQALKLPFLLRLASFFRKLFLKT